MNEKKISWNYLYIGIFIVTTVRLVWNFLYGFRWPSPYVLTNTVFTYESGFIPRAFLASVCKLFIGDHIYSYKFLYILIMGTTVIIYLLFMYMSYYFNFKQRNIVGSCVVLWFSLSIHSAYLVHEAGYFEQYGYVLLFLFILLSMRIKKTSYLFAFGAGIGFISLLISETNAFLTYSVILAICFMKVFEPLESDSNIVLAGGVKRNIFLLIFVNLPNLFYCLYVGIAGADPERVADQVRIIYNRPVKFERLESIYGYFVNRLPKDYIEKIDFKVWNWQLMCYLLLIVFTVSAVLFFSSRYLRVRNYILASVFLMVCIYVLNFIAWDTERFKFGAAMAVTLFGLWVCLSMDEKIIINKDIVYILIIGTLIMTAIMDYRLGLFDGAVYNNSWTQFKETCKSTWRINY